MYACLAGDAHTSHATYYIYKAQPCQARIYKKFFFVNYGKKTVKNFKNAYKYHKRAPPTDAAKCKYPLLRLNAKKLLRFCKSCGKSIIKDNIKEKDHDHTSST